MAVHLDERNDGGFALYIDGDFQFDTADEAIYHESLALPALCLARTAKPDGLRVLICGGGDGLALRECLQFPGVASVDLVDYDPTVVELARTRFAEINRQAFDDPRVTVHFRDAWQYLEETSTQDITPDPTRHPTANPRHPAFDVIICDFTVPRTSDQTRIFTREWYAKLSESLAPGGIIALNTVSPQTTPEAFWCLHRTVKASGLHALPYRVCIPSFRAHGYGAWAFLLASNRSLSIKDLRSLDCPVTTEQTDLSRLWRGASFRRAERAVERRVPIHSLENNCLLPLLLNPGMRAELTSGSDPAAPYDIEPLLQNIPITHPYHTRVMIETLAQQVAETIEQIDVKRLVEALLRRAARLPEALREELTRLRAFLLGSNLEWDRFANWSARLFAALVILMTLANAIAPDNAFAKGSAGLGHAGVSRGYSGSFGSSSTGRGSFSSANRGSSSFSGASPRGSFGRSGSFGSRGLFDHSYSAPRLQSSGFRTSYGNGRPVDLYGRDYYIPYYHYYYGGTHNYFGNQPDAPKSGPQEEHKPLFAADDDLLVMDNGDIIVTLSDRAYLLITDGKVVLRSDKAQEPLMALYPDPAFFDAIIGQLRDRQNALEQEIGVRRDWLSWVGWTSALIPAIAQDKTELNHMQDLERRLEFSDQPHGSAAPERETPLPPLSTGQVELFADARLQPDGRVALRQANGKWLYTDGKTIEQEGSAFSTASPSVPCAPALTVALRSVLVKLQKEIKGDANSLAHDHDQLLSDKASLQRDLTEYNSLLASHDPSYEVDYGTSEISVSDAISRTQRDIDQANKDIAENEKDHDKQLADLARLTQAATALRP